MMKNIFKIFIILSILVITLSACDGTSKPSSNELGDIPISFSLAPLVELNVEVTSGIVTLTKGVELARSLVIANDTASTTVTDLDPGLWSLVVEIYSNDYVVAEGTAEVQVNPGEVSEVELTLVINDVTGGISIVVDWEEPQTYPERILFIGNSYTYSNNGLDNIFREFASTSNAEIELSTMAITGGGMTLENHFNNQATINTIQTGNWDYVILQEQSQMPYLETETFLTYATKLDSVIDLTGAQTCFFMTWAREYDQTQIEGLSSAYLHAGEELDAMVVPVGQVFNYIFEADNEIELYVGDGSHPSASGSYVAAACFYKKIFNAPVTQTIYANPNVTDVNALYIRNTVEDWFAGHRN